MSRHNDGAVTVCAVIFFAILPACAKRDDAPKTFFQCLQPVSASACPGSTSIRQWCEDISAKTTRNPSRSCRGVSWTIPDSLRPTPKSDPVPANEGIMLFAFPNPAGSSEFYSRLDIDPLPFANVDFEIHRTRSIWQLNDRSAELAGYVVYTGGVPGDYRALLAPVNSDEYFLLCSRKIKQPGLSLVGACSVTLKYDKILKLSYYVPAESVQRTEVFNREILARVDALRTKRH